MVERYTETPVNIREITPYVITDPNVIVDEIFTRETCFFYDACSFRRHANLRQEEALCIIKYIKAKRGAVIFTRCILMELASHSGVLNDEYMEYVKLLSENDIVVLLMYEEDLFDVLSAVYSTNEVVNQHLCWAVRSIKSPSSTIAETLGQNSELEEKVIKGKNLNNSNMYKRFFSAVRRNKKSDDDLGEELLAICLYLLAGLPGEEDGKFYVITDDKNAAGKLYQMNKIAENHVDGKKIIILSTPKLTQIMFREYFVAEREQVKRLLSIGTSGNLVILGARLYDIRSKDISISSDELADLLLTPNAINIIF